MSLRDVCDFVEDVHVLTSEKDTLFRGPNSVLPLNGLYVFFETGQRITIKSKEYNRIVRIGINEKPNNFGNRLRGHYRGNIEGSVFRENIGWALLDADGKKPRENYKTKCNYRKQNSGGALEKGISDYFSKALTFKAFRLDNHKLASYEKTLIAVFSIYYQYKLFRKELNLGDWLGLHSYSRLDRIRRSGLWNSEGVVLVDYLSSLEAAKVVHGGISDLTLKDLIVVLIHSII